MEERQGPFTCQCGFLLLAIRVICYVCSEAQQWPTLCNHMDCSPTGSSVQGILPARILEWAPFPPPGDLPNPGIEPMSLTSPAWEERFFTTSATWEAPFLEVSVQFSCLIVSDSLRPHELQHARPPCPSPSPGVHSNSCPLSQ